MDEKQESIHIALSIAWRPLDPNQPGRQGQPCRDWTVRRSPGTTAFVSAGAPTPDRCHPCGTAAEENIAFIHRGLGAFSRGDFEVGAELMQPDVEWHVSFRLPDLPMGKTVYRGPDEVMRLWAAFRSVWDELSVTLEEVVEAHGEVVVVRARFVGRGSASGVEVDRTLFYVFEIAAGKLKRLRPFDTEAEALAAAGSEGVGR